MLIILLIFFLIFAKPIFAAPTVTITDIPETIVAGNIFNITFTVSGAEVGTVYHFKAMNDLDNGNVLTQPNLSCTGRYDSCENINIATASANIATASAKINMVSGVQNLRIRIAKDDNHSSKFDSQLVSLNSIMPTPTPTAIPTSTPNPTSTNTPTPTKTPTPTSTLTPTKTSTPSATLTPIIDEISNIPIITPTPESMILGETTTIEGTTKKNFLPLILIIGGGVLLLSPLIITKIKK